MSCFLASAITVVLSLQGGPPGAADQDAPVRLLLIGQEATDDEPADHQYLAGLGVVARCLDSTANLKLSSVSADQAWEDGPGRLGKADGVVLFLPEGAKWMHADPQRLAAFAHLAARGGGLVALHGAVGTSEARYENGFLKLFGGCHGGPQHQRQLLEAKLRRTDPEHPILAGIEDFTVRDEFLYGLKFLQGTDSLRPLLTVNIADQAETVAWCWNRPDGGRSFGFTGLCLHENWRLPAYRRLVAQAVLWSVKLPVPKDGLPVDLDLDQIRNPKSEIRNKFKSPNFK